MDQFVCMNPEELADSSDHLPNEVYEVELWKMSDHWMLMVDVVLRGFREGTQSPNHHSQNPS